MKLDAKDVEALAKSRVYRGEGNKPTYWLVGCIIVILIGAFVTTKYSIGIGWVLAGIGMISYIVYQNTLSKKTSIYKGQLIDEWNKEQQELNK